MKKKWFWLLGIILLFVFSVVACTGDSSVSPDGRYKVEKVHNDFGIHCQVTEIATGKIKATTEAQFKTRNDVKRCAFSPDSQKIAGVYHYSGPYTWVSVSHIETGKSLGGTRLPSWTTEIPDRAFRK